MSQSPSDLELNLNESTATPAVSNNMGPVEASKSATDTTVDAATTQLTADPQASKVEQQRARASRLMQAVRDEL